MPYKCLSTNIKNRTPNIYTKNSEKYNNLIIPIYSTSYFIFEEGPITVFLDLLLPLDHHLHNFGSSLTISPY
jgi:hypothetical protein